MTVTLKTSLSTLTGELELRQGVLVLAGATSPDYDDDFPSDEVLSTSLRAYGYIEFPGEVFIKDWSEHSGLAAALVDAGAGEITETLTVGPFDSRAYRFQLAPEVLASHEVSGD